MPATSNFLASLFHKSSPQPQESIHAPALAGRDFVSRRSEMMLMCILAERARAAEVEAAHRRVHPEPFRDDDDVWMS